MPPPGIAGAPAGDDGPPRSGVRPTRHSPPHGDIADADVTAAAAAAPRGSATGCSPKHGAERSAAAAVTPSSLFAPNPRARGARRASDVGPRSDPHSGGQQRDPLAPPAGRRRRFLFSGWGRNDRSTAAGRALRGTGYRQTGGIERSALSCPVILVRAESSCARGAPSQRRRSAERPTFRWSAA